MTRALPRQSVESPNAAHQPPLFYTLAAALIAPVDAGDQSGAFRLNPGFMWSGHGGGDVNAARHGTAETFPYAGVALALHLARLLNAALGAVAVGLTVVLASRLLPGRPGLASAAGGIAALNPQALFIHGAANNDGMATLLATATMVAAVGALRRPERAGGWLGAGALAGLGLLAKTTTLAASGIAATLAVVLGRLRGVTAFAIAFAAIVGWWLARNQLEYGDPFGRTIYRQAWAANIRSEPVDPLGFAELTFKSFWGVFGWMNVFLPSAVYYVLAFVVAVAAVGVGVGLVRDPGARDGVVAASLFVGAQLALLLVLIVDCNESCYQGRYLFPALGPISILLAYGLGPLRWPFVAALAALAIAAPVSVIAPAYPLTPLTKSEAAAIPGNVGATFTEAFELLGYEATGDGVTLYWHARAAPAFDYSAFVHQLDANGAIVAQQDHPPGRDRDYPPTRWLPGDVVRDEHRLGVEPVGEVRVGLYDWRSGQRLGEPVAFVLP